MWKLCDWEKRHCTLVCVARKCQVQEVISLLGMWLGGVINMAAQLAPNPRVAWFVCGFKIWVHDCCVT